MVYQGKTISLHVDQQHIAHMVFDGPESVNKFDIATIEELQKSVATLATMKDVNGLLIKSGKASFVVGADIKQFSELFARDQEEIAQAVVDFNKVFTALQSLAMPTVAVIDGMALGGGFELALACDYRVAGPNAKVGLPEVKLGINPGFGGTIRLPRLIGIDNAIEWIATGSEYRGEKALAVGAIDALVSSEQLEASALQIISDANAGKLDYQARKQEKIEPVKLNDMERLMAFITAKGLVAQQAGPHMPAPVTAVKSIEQSAALSLDEATAIEGKFFARLAKTDVSKNLVNLFLNEQDLSKRAAKLTQSLDKPQQIAVIGAGIMGGGIAYQAAYKGVNALMKDVAQKGIDQGLEEASKLLAKRVERGRMSPQEMASTLHRIQPTLHYVGFDEVEIAVEAVVENLNVKQKVLQELESQLPEDAVLCSNTSTISITMMGESLKKPENFCGMHFFNPVHKMPLVEVIRSKHTSEATTAKVVNLAKAMGKTPIVVNDCPGFYVNRVLFPYLAGFNMLLSEGFDFRAIDKIMEKFGWPMGPAYLIDVVGIDTAFHAASVMAEGFPTRMAYEGTTALEHMYNNNRFGQKNGKGFYCYELDKKGKPKKMNDPEADNIVAKAVKGSAPEITEQVEQQIIERLMLPMCFEVVRCIEEGIVESPIDADMGLLMGIGFPLFRGGAVAYMETIGLKTIVEQAQAYQHLGELYQVPDLLQTLANNGQTFLQHANA